LENENVSTLISKQSENDQKWHRLNKISKLQPVIKHEAEIVKG